MRDDRLNDELIHRARNQAPDEPAVDLDVVEWKVLEVVERAESRAEVVEGKLATATAQAGGEGSRLFKIADRGRLGQLEDQTSRIDSCFIQCSLR